MTVKALKKQLMAAIAMVVVSAIALSSSTYAWFASNNKVTATTTKVQAQAEDGLEIAYSSTGEVISANGSFSTAASAEGDAVHLLPASTVNATNWFHASAVNSTASAANDQTMVAISPDAVTGMVGDNQYFLLNKFTIRTASGGSNKDVKISKVVVTSGTVSADALDNSLRVVVTNGTNTFFFKPTLTAGDDTNPGNQQVSAVTVNEGVTSVTREKVVLYPTQPDVASQQTILSDIDHDGANVSIYVYYEGEDGTLYSNNISTAIVAGLNITVEFTGYDVTP